MAIAPGRGGSRGGATVAMAHPENIQQALDKIKVSVLVNLKPAAKLTKLLMHALKLHIMHFSSKSYQIKSICPFAFKLNSRSWSTKR
jgi:hypothetical protein